ncbi:MAG: alpha-amylase [Spirochaetes bacterium]|jgi:sucrose phosphorylase|nr:alpha-amylase [Spirochaetota bacterium]
MNQRIYDLLSEIYGPDAGESAAARVHELLLRYSERIEHPLPAAGAPAEDEPPVPLPVTERDTIMITYGDQFRGADGTPLSYLYRFLDEETEGAISGVHILPFWPYSSDDGFSIIDYRRVDPRVGDWSDIEQIGADYSLMADLVLNHCSAQSRWFEGFLKSESPYTEYFITVDPDTDLSMVARPRAHPLLTPFETTEGTKYVWTTFSADQVDLNFRSPRVLEEMLDVLLLYVERGARIIRLDAIAYLWKEIGHPSIHHPKTHLLVQLFRAVIEDIAPWVVVITETNVPHTENLSYFGDGYNEAHMVYNFSLPPLVLDAFLREDTGHLTTWAAGLDRPSDAVSFFNFLASHDGIGLLPARGILAAEEIERMIETVETRGGRISYKATPDGEIPYEMNVNYLSAVTDPNVPTAQRARAFLASQAIMLAMAGVPGVYVHSLLGSTNWEEGVEQTGVNRSINREKLDYATIVDDINTEGTLRATVFEGYRRMLQVRAAEPAFPQRILEAGHQVFVVLRGAADDTAGATASPLVLCLHNVSSGEAECRFHTGDIGSPAENTFRELVSEDVFFPHWEKGRAGEFSVELEAFEVMWLKLR